MSVNYSNANKHILCVNLKIRHKKEMIFDFKHYKNSFYIENISEVLRINNYIKVLNLSYLGMDRINPLEFSNFKLEKFLDIIIKNSSIQVLDLSLNLLGPSFLIYERLETLLKLNKLQALYLSFNFFGLFESNFYKLCNALAYSERITSLSLGMNQLGMNTNNVRNLKQLVINHVCLQILNLSENKLACHFSNIEMLAEIIIKNKTLKQLNLSRNNLGISVNNIKTLTHALMQNKFIENLDLSFNDLHLYHEGQKILCEIFIQNRTQIKKLTLSGNFIGDDTHYTELICEIIKNNRFIQNMNLSSNLFTNVNNNSSRISLALSCNKILKSFNFAKNNIGIDREACNLFSQLLRKNTTLIKLSLNSCYIFANEFRQDHLLNEFSKSLIKNKSIKSINLSANFNRSCLKYRDFILKILEKNQSIEKIKLNDNSLFVNDGTMRPTYIREFFNVLKENKRIKKIQLKANTHDTKLTTELCYCLYEILRENKTITEIDLSKNYFFDIDKTVSFLDNVFTYNKVIKEIKVKENILNYLPSQVFN